MGLFLKYMSYILQLLAAEGSYWVLISLRTEYLYLNSQAVEQDELLNKSEVEEDSDLVEDVEAGKKTKQSSGKVYEQRDEEKLSLIEILLKKRVAEEL